MAPIDPVYIDFEERFKNYTSGFKDESGETINLQEFSKMTNNFVHETFKDQCRIENKKKKRMIIALWALGLYFLYLFNWWSILIVIAIILLTW